MNLVLLLLGKIINFQLGFRLFNGRSVVNLYVQGIQPINYFKTTYIKSKKQNNKNVTKMKSILPKNSKTQIKATVCKMLKKILVT